MRAADRIVDLVYGGSDRSGELSGHARIVDPDPGELLVAPQHLELARRTLRHQVEHASGPLLVVRGANGSGRLSLISVIARELDARLMIVAAAELPANTIRAIQREAILARAVIVLANAGSLEMIGIWFASYPGPIAITLASDGDPAALAAGRGATTIDMPVLTEAERRVLWVRHVDDELATEAALRYRLTGGQIQLVARHAKDRGEGVNLDTIHAGVRAVLDNGLATLGTRLEWTQQWHDLVLPDDSREELGELVDRVQYRRKVIDEWGFGSKVAKGLGVAALFYGPPGTGKTMAAGLVANRLGLDLYQIDVSRLVSKYIGETEKNLSKVFEAAEAGHAVLLFDEADSLFAKRTEVKSSVDRYANLEVNYLLQRMESFNGITILTTNFESSLDEAFRRRLAYRIRFPIPELDERERLWQSIIPEKAIGSDVNFHTLAQRFAMTGGYIKNAALRAAFIAAAEHGRIEMRHLLRAANAEYASLGKVMTQGTARGL
ncbi:MAG: ATP-binding protein [Kofleriaceae bacterium]